MRTGVKQTRQKRTTFFFRCFDLRKVDKKRFFSFTLQIELFTCYVGTSNLNTLFQFAQFKFKK